MTTKTRRSVFLCALVLALTLPAESILLKALQEPDSQQAVQDWASSLDGSSLAVASDRIQAYPFAYRKGIMRALAPDRRAAVWQAHIGRYIKGHPELDATAIAVLRAAQSAATPEALSQPTAKTRASIHAVAEQVVALLGKRTAEYLMFRLGPADGTFASAEPLSMKLAERVRGVFRLMAASPDCDCNLYFGCQAAGADCMSQIYCNVDDWWPACGWFWSDTCDGLCGAGW